MAVTPVRGALIKAEGPNSILEKFRVTLTQQVNASIVWWRGNSPRRSANPATVNGTIDINNILGTTNVVTPNDQPSGPGVEVGAPTYGNDIDTPAHGPFQGASGSVIGSDQIAHTMGAYLSMFSKVRKLQYTERYGSSSWSNAGSQPAPTYSVVFKDTQVAHLTDPYRRISEADAYTALKPIIEAVAIDHDNNSTTPDKFQINANMLNTAVNQALVMWSTYKDTVASDTTITSDFCHSSCHQSCHSKGRGG